MTAVKGEDVVIVGLISQAKREDNHTSIANLTPPCIQIDDLMEVWKTRLSEFTGKTFYKVNNTTAGFPMVCRSALL